MTVLNVNSPFRVIICFLVIAIAGCCASFRLSVDLLPEQASTVFTISFSQANTSPDILEQQCTSLIENACSQLSQLKQIRSVSGYNSGSVQLEFDRHTDMALKQLELTALIRQIYPLLPSSVSYPAISRSKHNSETAQSLLQAYTIRAPFQPYEIKENAETVFRKAFAGVPGIQDLRISGTEQMQVNISFDKEKCEALRIVPAAIINAIHASFSPSYPGVVQGSHGEEYFLQLAIPEASIDQLSDIVLANTTRIKDIAQIYMAPREPDVYFRINGRNAVTLSIYGRAGENKIVLGKLCRQIVQRASTQLPAGYHVSLSYDAMSFLEKEIRKNYTRAGLSIIILLFFLLVSYRNVRYLLNLFAALLLSISITFLLAWIFHISLHLYTLAGLAISFGIITDNAIVMLDHYHRLRNRKIATALLGSALTTIAALLLVALPDFSVIVILALVSSLVSTIWFMPALYKLTIPSAPQRGKQYFQQASSMSRKAGYYYTTIRSLARYRALFIVLIISLFGLPVFLLPAKWEGKHWYNNLYNITLGNTAYQEHARVYVDKWLGGSLRLFVSKLQETNDNPNPGQTKLLVEAELPYGHTPAQMNDILLAFEQYLGKVKGIDKYVTAVYSGQKGNIEITFKDGLHNLPHLLKERLVAHSMNWGGVAWNIWGIGQGFSNTSQDEVPHYRVMLKGYNYDELERQAAVMAAKLGKYRRVQKININEKVSGSDEQSDGYTLRLDKGYLALYGAHLFEVLNKLSDLFVPAGPAAQLTLNNRYYPLVLKEQNAAEYSRHKLLNDALALDSSKIIRLREAGSLELENTINSIYRENRQYVRMLSFDYMGPSQSGIQHLTDLLKEMNTEMPAGYSAAPVYIKPGWGAQGNKYTMIAILFLLIFFICGILFEHLKQSFFIVCIIPVSFIGLFLVCSLVNFPWDQGGYAAFIMLGALVSNAGIFVINDFNRFKHRRASPYRYNSLLIHTIMYRSRTILLTTIATCCSLIPFLVEGHKEPFWFPLAACITAGLPFLLLAVFLVLPVLLWKRDK